MTRRRTHSKKPQRPNPSLQPSPRPFVQTRARSFCRRGNGAVVNGVVPIVGTAQHDQFSFYKLEIAPSGANQSFSYLAGAESPVVGGLLGNLDSSNVAAGTYTVQLVVVDRTGNYPSPCRVTVVVQN